MLTMSIVNAVTYRPNLRPSQPSFWIKEFRRITCHIIIIYKNIELEYTKKLSINKYQAFAV